MGALGGIRKRYIGNGAFYKAVLLLVLPIVAQQGITSFVNLLDNVMVGKLGTSSISGVAIVNQLIFVFNITIFGGLSGPSIYGAQFAGIKDYDGVRHTLAFKLMLGTAVSIIALTIYVLFGDQLIAMYLNSEENSPEMMALTLNEARRYMRIALFALVPFMLSQAYGTTLREMGDTVPPMIASVISLCVNFSLNYVLIYGKLGFPEMGVSGAALATAIARCAEIGFLLIYIRVKRSHFAYALGISKALRIPAALVKKICITGAPLLINEFLWSVGQALINQCYSVRGLQTVAAVNITSTVWQLFAIIMFSMGSAISILVGQKLGEGDIEGARDTDRKLIVLDVAMHVLIGLLIIVLSGAIPNLYNTEPEVRALTSGMLVMAGIALPFNTLAQASYFTLRSGGRSVLTFLFDSVFCSVIVLPLAYVLCNFTKLDVVYVFLCIQMCNALKAAIGIPLVVSGMWARNIIALPAKPKEA